MGVSGSRSAVLAVAVVVASLAVILVIRPSAVNKFGRHLLLAALVFWMITYLPIFREGIGILSDRFTESAEDGDTSVVEGLIGRTIDGFTEGAQVITKAPVGGYGLGVGTSGGASFLVGQGSFLLAENEWSRIILESGPVLGLAFILWRCALTYRVGSFALRQLRAGNTLPTLLFSAAFFVMLEGPFGQPTSLGFAVVLAGLCLAARPNEERIDTEPAETKETEDQELATRRPRRSAYAERLHAPRITFHPPNGSSDR
jgi:O-antigen ligase